MAEMEQVGLNLVVSAEDRTEGALSELRSTLEELASLASHAFENIAVSGYSAANSLTEDFRGLSKTVRESLEGLASHAFEPLALAGDEAVKSLKQDFISLRDEIEKDMKEAAESASRSLSEIKEPVPAGGGGHGGKGKSGGIFGIEGQMDTMYAGMSMGAAALPIVGFVKDAIQAYAQFDEAVANVNTMLHLHGSQLEHLKQQLIDLSKVVPQAPAELADGLYSVVGAGVDSAHAMDVLKIAAEAAAAGQTDMDTATRALVSVMDSYGMKASQVGQISDILFAANQAGAMTFRDLASSIGTVAGPAANAGVSFKEVAAATAALTNTGLSAQRATQGLRALIIGIQNPTKTAQKEAKQLGIEWDASALKAHGLAGMIQLAMQATHGNSEELKKLIPNIAAYTAAVDLGGKGAQAFKNALDTVNHSAGATDQAMKSIRDSAAFNLKEFSKSWEELQMTFAANVLPTITSVMNRIKELIDGFGRLSPGMQKAISYGVLGAGAFLSLGSAMFMSISAIGSIISGVTRLAGPFLTATRAVLGLQAGERILPALGRLIMTLVSDFGLLGRAVTLFSGPWGILIAAVVTGVTLIITHWNQIAAWVKQNFGITLPTTMKQWQNVFSTVWNAIKKVVEEAWNYIKPTIISGIQTVEKYWKQIWPELKELFQEVWTVIKAILAPIIAWMVTQITFTLGEIKSTWHDAWNMMKDSLKFAWDAIKGIVKTGWDIVSGIFKVALDLLTGHWGQAWKDMKSTCSNVWNDIKSTVSNLIDDAINWGSNLINMLADGIKNAIPSLEKAASSAAATIKNFLGFSSPTKLGPASTSDRWAPNFMKMFASGIEDNKELIENAVTHTAQLLQDGFTLPKTKTATIAQPVLNQEKAIIDTVKPIISEYDRVAGHTTNIPSTTTEYDRVAGHSSNIPTTTTLYDRIGGHTSNQPVVHIHIEGRSAQTDQQLVNMIADHLGRKFRTHLTVATPR